MKTHLGFALLMLTFPMSASLSAQTLPKECEGPGLQTDYATFSSVFSISMLQTLCAAIASETSPSFNRVLARYKARSPACYEATLSHPDLVAFRVSTEVSREIEMHRSGVAPSHTARLVKECETIEDSENQRWQEREAIESLLPKFPASPSDG